MLLSIHSMFLYSMIPPTSLTATHDSSPTTDHPPTECTSQDVCCVGNYPQHIRQFVCIQCTGTLNHCTIPPPPHGQSPVAPPTTDHNNWKMTPNPHLTPNPLPSSWKTHALQPNRTKQPCKTIPHHDDVPFAILIPTYSCNHTASTTDEMVQIESICLCTTDINQVPSAEFSSERLTWADFVKQYQIPGILDFSISNSLNSQQSIDSLYSLL